MKTSDINNIGNAYRSIYEAKTKEEVSDNKEFVPHMMYDPETGEGHKAEKPEDHERMKKMGYTHEEPDMVKEKKLPRQMLDPKKDVMVVKNNKVIVIDKSKEAEYLKKGWGLAEQVEEAVSPAQQAAIAISKKEKEEMKNESNFERNPHAKVKKIKRPKQGDYKNYIDLRPSKLNAPGGRDKVKYTPEGNVKDLAMKIDKVVAKMNKDSKLKPHAKKFASMAMDTMDIEKSLEKSLPSSVSGAAMIGLLEGNTKNEDASQFVAAARQAKKDGQDTFMFADKEYPVTCKEVEEAEKKLDPVDDAANDKKFKDRKDKDIDNDGDVDDSDKYLHNRRAKVDDIIDGGKKPAKNVKKEEMNPTDHVKKKGDKFCVYNADGSIAKEFDNKEDADKYAIDNHDKIMATAKKEEDEKDPKEKEVAKSPKTAEISKIGEEFVAFLEAAIKPDEKLKSDPKDKDGKELSKGALDDEEIDEKEPKKGKEFIKKHDGSDKDIEDKEEESREVVTKAGSNATKPKSGKRDVDSTVGDSKVVNPVKEGKAVSLVDQARAHLAGEKNPHLFGKEEPKVKKEINHFDGRTKLAREFMQRMDKRRGITHDKKEVK